MCCEDFDCEFVREIYYLLGNDSRSAQGMINSRYKIAVAPSIFGINFIVAFLKDFQ